jgi:ubiquinone/menaquinone biosynthesis C-methylase UbiE/uncharacterized protein YbaR (Trm112 family)
VTRAGIAFADVARLACPTCRGALAYDGPCADAPRAGALVCGGCAARWPIADGLPRLFVEAEVRGNDRLMRLFYEGLPALHDPAVRFVLPVMQGSSEESLRRNYMRRLDLESLRPRPDGQPVRILEVGVGCGANVHRVLQGLPPGLPVELWGMDLAAGMMRVLRRRLPRRGVPLPRLVQADAHALPFPDAAFDRVFHVGGIAGYRDPRRALAEMARVARPGTPIVVVDEQLDPAIHHGLLRRALFFGATFYDPDTRCPRDLLPPNAYDVREEQASTCYYCLTFRMPGAPPR